MNKPKHTKQFIEFIEGFNQFGRKTRIEQIPLCGQTIPRYLNEYWASGHYPTNRIHEFSYRACYKSALPEFFIKQLTLPNDTVFDPFMGRGTTLVEAWLRGRYPCGNDINPVSHILTASRMNPPKSKEVEEALNFLFDEVFPLVSVDYEEDMEAFYHPNTLLEILKLREFLLSHNFRREREQRKNVYLWIAAIVMSRLSGTGAAYLSGYTMPAAAAVNLKRQKKINEQEGLRPYYKDTKEIILAKSERMLSEMNEEIYKLAEQYGTEAELTAFSSDQIRLPKRGQVDLTLTSPPFLDAIDYKGDNWLRGWFMKVDTKTLPIWQSSDIAEWRNSMLKVFRNLYKITKPYGYVAWEVGDVHKGTVKLDEISMELGIMTGFKPVCIVKNVQDFAKVSSLYGVKNNELGTNSNNICILEKA